MRAHAALDVFVEETKAVAVVPPDIGVGQRRDRDESADVAAV